MSLDLVPALLKSFTDQQDTFLQATATAILALVEEWEGEPAIFGFRPLPADAPDLVIVIESAAAIGDADALNSERPFVQHDIKVYGRRGSPGEADDQSEKVEQIGFLMRDLFHRQKFSVQPTGYSVTEIGVRGPVPAPADDDGTIGRMVNLTIRLRRIPA